MCILWALVGAGLVGGPGWAGLDWGEVVLLLQVLVAGGWCSGHKP